MNNETIIDITRVEGKLSSVKVIMPIWTNDTGNGIQILIPLFGGLETFAKSDADIYKTTEEAIKIFCIASEKFGKGLEAELESIGWKKFQSEKQHVTLNVDSSVPVIDFMLGTGDPQAFSVNMAMAA